MSEPITKPIPFRDMRVALKLARTEVGVLLGLPNVEWPQSEYATFLAIVDVSKRMDNPTRTQMLTQLGVWLRFYRRLIESLPESSLRANCQTQFDTLSAPYQGLLDVQPEQVTP